MQKSKYPPSCIILTAVGTDRLLLVYPMLMDCPSGSIVSYLISEGLEHMYDQLRQLKIVAPDTDNSQFDFDMDLSDAEGPLLVITVTKDNGVEVPVANCWVNAFEGVVAPIDVELPTPGMKASDVANALNSGLSLKNPEFFDRMVDSLGELLVDIIPRDHLIVIMAADPMGAMDMIISHPAMTIEKVNALRTMIRELGAELATSTERPANTALH